MSTPLRVDVYDDATMEIVSRNGLLADVIEDHNERWTVTKELRAMGRAWIGGGAAPLFYLAIVR